LKAIAQAFLRLTGLAAALAIIPAIILLLRPALRRL
jgi:hypothetical protein